MLKYLIIRVRRSGREYSILFPVGLVHRAVASLYLTDGQEVVSAGFCLLGENVVAFGGSDTLQMDSRPIDAKIIENDFASPDGCSGYAAG